MALSLRELAEQALQLGPQFSVRTDILRPSAEDGPSSVSLRDRLLDLDQSLGMRIRYDGFKCWDEQEYFSDEVYFITASIDLSSSATAGARTILRTTKMYGDVDKGESFDDDITIWGQGKGENDESFDTTGIDEEWQAPVVAPSCLHTVAHRLQSSCGFGCDLRDGVLV